MYFDKDLDTWCLILYIYIRSAQNNVMKNVISTWTNKMCLFMFLHTPLILGIIVSLLFKSFRVVIVLISRSMLCVLRSLSISPKFLSISTLLITKFSVTSQATCSTLSVNSSVSILSFRCKCDVIQSDIQKGVIVLETLYNLGQTSLHKSNKCAFTLAL